MPLPEKLVTNRIGRQYWIYDGDTFYDQRIGGAGPYQKKNLVFLRNQVPNARTVIDVGMNIGMNAIEYATWAQEVIGFEPTTQTYEMALKNIKLNRDSYSIGEGWYTPNKGQAPASLAVSGKITAYAVGLSDKSTVSKIVIHKNNAGSNHVTEGVKRAGRDGQVVQTIKLKTLDSYKFQNVDIIKYDIEGHEFAGITGSLDTIRRCRPVLQVEMLETHTKRYGTSVQDVIDLVMNEGYDMYLATGEQMPQTWEYRLKMADRFFIPR